MWMEVSQHQTLRFNVPPFSYDGAGILGECIILIKLKLFHRF